MRNTATIISISEQVDPRPDLGFGGFYVESNSFIPGFSLSDLRPLFNQISINGRYRLAGGPFIVINENEARKEIDHVQFNIAGQVVGNTKISLEFSDANQNSKSLSVKNIDQGSATGFSNLEVTETTFMGSTGLLIKQTGQYHNDAELGNALLNLMYPTGMSSPLSHIFGYVHVASYNPSAIANLLYDTYPNKAKRISFKNIF
ncbi:MAG: hypothetical protein SGI74_05245 [Oligoflexia bacterium]|nr:hypothetical protein [Oligoflexia bacterium]